MIDFTIMSTEELNKYATCIMILELNGKREPTEDEISVIKEKLINGEITVDDDGE